MSEKTTAPSTAEAQQQQAPAKKVEDASSASAEKQVQRPAIKPAVVRAKWGKGRNVEAEERAM